MGRIYEFLSPVIVFFSFLFSLLRGFFMAIKHGFQSLIVMGRSIRYFDYKQFLFSVKERVKDYPFQVKAKAYKIVWIPIRKRMFRLRKQARKKLLDVRIYFRGFLELCRRLFLLVSDYTPGGQWTVGFCLLLSTIFIGIEMVRYSRFVFKLLDLALSSMMFLLSPVLWTLEDVWIVFAFVLNIFFSLVRYIWLLFMASLQGIGNFVLRVLTAFLSVIYRILSWIFELRCVQYVWHVFLEITLMTMEVFIFRVLPVLMTIVSHLITISTIASRYFYEYFVAVYAAEEKEHEYFSNTRICAAILTVICLILAYRYRKTFPSDLCQEIEEEGSTAGTRSRTRRLKTARYSKTGRKDDTTGHEDEGEYCTICRIRVAFDISIIIHRSCSQPRISLKGIWDIVLCVLIQSRMPKRIWYSLSLVVHFQLSSSAHICTGFLREECKKGRRCEGHHCPWPYHWQYRVPVQGWKSFSQSDSDTIEQLYCDPTNEITKTSDIDPDLSALTRR